MTAIAYIEKQMRPHDPDLYRNLGDANRVSGLGAVDAAAVAQYEQQGFLLIRPAISADYIHRASDELRSMTEADDPGCQAIYYEGMMRQRLGWEQFDPTMPDVPKLADLRMSETIDAIAELPRDVRSQSVRKFMGFVQHHPPLADVANYPPLVEAATRIVGEPVRLFQDMAMIKPPGGREKPWHQDHAYFNLPIDTRIVAVWIALSDATVENGCMHVIPGGHRGGPRVHFAKRDWQLCDEHILQESHQALPMAAGDLMLFDGKLPHGTPTNRTDDWRWALQFHYLPRSASEVDESVRLQAFGSEGKDVTC